MRHFHMLVNGVQEGPISEFDLRRRLVDGRASLSDFCWIEGWDDWKTIEDALSPREDSSGSALKKEPEASVTTLPKRIEPRKEPDSMAKFADDAKAGAGLKFEPNLIPQPKPYTATDRDRKLARDAAENAAKSQNNFVPGCALFVGVSTLYYMAFGFIGIFIAMIHNFAPGFAIAVTMIGLLAGVPVSIVLPILFLRSSREKQIPIQTERELQQIVTQRVAQINSEYESKLRSERSEVSELEFRCKRQLSSYGDSHIERLFTQVQNIDQTVDDAERLLSENAVIPFWESVDLAMKQLAQFRDEVKETQKVAASYRQSLSKRKNNFPPFPVTREQLPSADLAFVRLKAIVDHAFRSTNSHFSVIYEQRKTTNAILDGFNGMQEALEHLHRDICQSFVGLAREVRSVGDKVESLEGSQNRNAERLRDKAEQEASSQRERSRADAEHQALIQQSLQRIQENTDPLR